MCSMCMKYEALIMNLIKSQCAYRFLVFCLVVVISPVSFTHIIFDTSMDKKITCTVKCGMELLIHPQTSAVAPLKFGMDKLFHHTHHINNI